MARPRIGKTQEERMEDAITRANLRAELKAIKEAKTVVIDESPVEPPPKYEIAPEIFELYVFPLIQDHRSDLVEARILTMWRRGPWTSQNRETWAKAKKVSQETETLIGAKADFIITVSEDVWEQLDDKQRMALIDHELCHCLRGDDDKYGNPKWEMVGHDIEEFFAVIKRHGDWSEDIKRALWAFEHRQEAQQLKIVDLEGEKQKRQEVQRDAKFAETFAD